MKLIEDLGTRECGDRRHKRRYGLYECPICNKHIECLATSVKSGNTTKCRSCADNTKALIRSDRAAKEFTAKAIAIHGTANDYSLVDYVNSCTKVEIICYTHGAYTQTPNAHLNGQGCPECARARSDIALHMSEKNDRPTILYYIHFPEVNLWKIGCTSKTVEERFRDEKLEYTIIQTKEYTSGYTAYRVEKFILDTTKEYKFKYKILRSGNSELRTQQIENFEIILQEAEVRILEGRLL